MLQGMGAVYIEPSCRCHPVTGSAALIKTSSPGAASNVIGAPVRLGEETSTR